MHNVEVWGGGGCPSTLSIRENSKGTEAEEELVGDIMALCIMAKCGRGCWDYVEMRREGGVGIGYAGISGSRA